MTGRRARKAAAAAVAGLVLAAGGIPSAAAPLFPPRAYRDARLKSEFHIQIAVDHVRVPSKTPGMCTVVGKIERVFRGNVAVGTPIELDLDCKKKDETVLPGQTLWSDVDTLSAAKHIEAFVNPGPYGFQHALWQYAVIPAATDKPTIDLETGVP